ncbi:branched-chain amino acid ABC transporter permease [Derxia gummosa]|uniref:Branched-chain amino acid ABC transporter permease n=1 Tax=Derxia gummosa DSM 723 TaxID=1121388 RepID=A0A8B6X911_9BURK|nr:branched-chain amino acid ABC transporter permease [Derxia gummosa]
MSITRISLGAVAALAAGAALGGSLSSGTALSLLTQATIHAIFALGVGLLLRQNGMVSFGHAAFFGSAGYIVAIVLEQQLASAETAIALAVLGVAAFAFVLALVAVRVPGIAFGMLTLAVGQMVYLVASRSRTLTGGADGMNVNWPSTLFGIDTARLLQPGTTFLVCWTALVLMIGALALLARSRFGAVTEAIRDNEERARFIGIRTLLPRAAVFALSAGVTAVAGVLAAFNTGFVSPESLHWSVSGAALMMVIVGGGRTLWGPALGAVVYFLARDFLGDFASHWMAIFGIALIAVIVFSPEGIAGALQRALRRRRPAPIATLDKQPAPASH